ncbi:hypothetical protein [Chitinophaga agrisoli]|nr:hypothetical protein [Chitinophaga agrisoli]
MKMRFVIPALLCAFTAFVSCSKTEDNPKPETETPGDDESPVDTSQPASHNFIGMIQGTGVDDTTFVFNYDANNRMKNVVNVSWEDSLIGTYNDAGNLSQMVLKDNGSITTVTYTYNAANQLTQISHKQGNDENRNVFEYTNGVVSKNSSYAVGPNGELSLGAYYIYEVTDGNITKIKSYSGGLFTGESTLTYNSDPNIFKSLSLFNDNSALGMNDIADQQTWFNKNMCTGSTFINTTQTTTVNAFTYTYNADQQLTKVVSTQTFAGSLYKTRTRKFSY